MYLHSIGIHRPSPDASIIIIYVYKCYPLPRYRFHNISQCINVQKNPVQVPLPVHRLVDDPDVQK